MTFREFYRSRYDPVGTTLDDYADSILECMSDYLEQELRKLKEEEMSRLKRDRVVYLGPYFKWVKNLPMWAAKAVLFMILMLLIAPATLLGALIAAVVLPVEMIRDWSKALKADRYE